MNEISGVISRMWSGVAMQMEHNTFWIMHTTVCGLRPLEMRAGGFVDDIFGCVI